MRQKSTEWVKILNHRIKLTDLENYNLSKRKAEDELVFEFIISGQKKEAIEKLNGKEDDNSNLTHAVKKLDKLLNIEDTNRPNSNYY